MKARTRLSICCTAVLVSAAGASFAQTPPAWDSTDSMGNPLDAAPATQVAPDRFAQNANPPSAEPARTARELRREQRRFLNRMNNEHSDSTHGIVGPFNIGLPGSVDRYGTYSTLD
jgi:hypothetical protein